MVVVEHCPSEEKRTCDICGTVMEKIGKEMRQILKVEPAASGARRMCTTSTPENSVRLKRAKAISEKHLSSRWPAQTDLPPRRQ